MALRWNFNKTRTKLKRLKRSMPRAIGVIARNHYKKSFKRGGFTDRTLNAWASRKGNKDPGRAILIGDGKKQPAGTLRDSIRITRQRFNDIRVGTNKKYARFHNKGTARHPKRQFIGESAKVTNQVKRLINKELRKIFV